MIYEGIASRDLLFMQAGGAWTMQIQLEGKISTLLLETGVLVRERVPFTVVSCAAAGADFHSVVIYDITNHSNSQ